MGRYRKELISRSVRRIIADIILVVFILFLPWWLTLIAASVLAFIFNWYYETLIAGFLIDSLYGSSIPIFLGFNAVATTLGILVFIASVLLKPHIRSYASSDL